ncbi:hypothetical protein L226DRAFT_541010 [Lentinus tigrinus ALCF2SS1-7]|uniref:uncharacterized protein n=1 Tax=Lentinus tigrinus ALCF2SS1-7 TaxID=1328758 RepID=UPI00116622EC|nr:hypothetical protein L226DRAFT_541010 [Lentinus tigrinus ALCF2SS1-7]
MQSQQSRISVSTRNYDQKRGEDIEIKQIGTDPNRIPRCRRRQSSCTRERENTTLSQAAAQGESIESRQTLISMRRIRR